MRFSEAIRIGARLRPQAMFHWFNKGRSCALGAAMEALTGRTVLLDVNPVKNAYPWAWMFATTICPVCHQRLSNVAVTITHLNDHHGWSREVIADWLEPIEKEYERSEALLSCISMSDRSPSRDVDVPTTLGDGAIEVEEPCEEGVPAGAM